MTTSFSYPPTRRWLDRVTTAMGTTVLMDNQYTRDKLGRIKTITGLAGNDNWTYGYDDLSRYHSLQIRSMGWAVQSSKIRDWASTAAAICSGVNGLRASLLEKRVTGSFYAGVLITVIRLNHITLASASCSMPTRRLIKSQIFRQSGKLSVLKLEAPG
ncbi:MULTISPECIES: hypothetical protein [Rhizobium]|uniref:hypothetical protein n=1 Tax=Rhizobium TaxID=379 RepID=UPI0007F11FDC|nr:MULTISPECIES: hypothetical protein [Rhizobium]ANK91387.1 hypothetical protein AMK01_CH01920 [Rhizobium sp. N6212]ANK97420.1 hypothetical protein AMK00_CH01922 [Rhizobium sp. N621]ANL09586.1 hypothetical protein AMJ98_CH01912 [Rhizobium sp. N1341]ANM34389.1 hypothetical protein AMK04_CH01992 [Rhizobium sp. N871]ANM40427.1 hypothetical protein AMK03_CH01912 [Rhizobium sp. N741]